MAAMNIATQEINAQQDLIPNCTLYINSSQYLGTDGMVPASIAMTSITGKLAIVAMIQ